MRSAYDGRGSAAAWDKSPENEGGCKSVASKYLLTSVRLSCNMRYRFSPGAAPANRRLTGFENKAVSDLGKPEKACTQCV